MKDFLYKCYKLVSTIPQRLGYDAVDARLHGVYSFHFWYRQIFHVVGGILFGALMWKLAGRWRPEIAIEGFVFMVIGITCMEFTQAEHGQKWIKTLLDPVFWTIGYWASVYTLTYLR